MANISVARNYDYGRGGDSKEYAGFGWYGDEGAAVGEGAGAYGYTFGMDSWHVKVPISA